MLIAIMGNTFTERSGIADQIRIRDHLKFVVRNWYLNDLAFENKDRLKYIITAFMAHEETNQSEVFDELKREVKSIKVKQDN